MQWSQFFTIKVQKQAGFRFNLLDVGLIVFLLVVTWLLYPVWQQGWLFLLPLYIGMSFFLFCNVFRIGNRLEPYWYIPFALCMLCFHKQPELLWWLILLLLEPLKLILIVYSIRRGDYHGAWMQRLSACSTISDKNNCTD